MTLLSRVEALTGPDRPQRPLFDKCATEGCNRQGTRRYEAGGVGSAYCPVCYEKIETLAVLRAKEGI